MDFNKSEKQLFYLLQIVKKSGRKVNKESIEETGEKVYKEKLLDLTEAYISLIKKKFVKEICGEYSLSNKAKKMIKEEKANSFGRMLVRKEKSKVYGKFCEQIHGKNISQFNMMNMKQLNKLLELLKLDKHHQILDLGCATGTITEYISDITNANITGVDFAEEAIKWAQDRTKSKKNRLKFLTMDMDKLDFPDTSFDVIISIDTLYFVEDLDNTIHRMKKILKQNGKMGIFYSQMIKTNDAEEMLFPDKTKLAQVLKQHNLKFKIWNFTEDEKEHWRKSKEIAEALKEDFQKEGNSEIYDSRIRESNVILEFVESCRVSRYLYLVELN